MDIMQAIELLIQLQFYIGLYIHKMNVFIQMCM